jgi:alkylated DNA repair dioxygenase AlkB
VAVPHQLSLLSTGEPAVDPDVAVVRDHLDGRCWVDLGRRWLRGGDELFGRCAEVLDWRQRNRPMFGELVVEPRLTAALHADAPDTPAVVTDIADALSDRYGTGLRHVWANWYRSGDDAVAWHADRVGRTEVDPVVAVLSIAGPRDLTMRPGPAPTTGAAADRPAEGHRRWTLHSGDLLVMGGACQHRWQHAVPRRRGAPPRMSLTFRARAG